MAKFGFTGAGARQFITRELEKAAPSTSFYWESDELEDLLDLMVDVMVKVIEANNAKITQDWEREMQKIARGL